MNNPQAFPNKHANSDSKAFCGMTLRDYFAAKVLQGLVTANEVEKWPGAAAQAYNAADAMLKAREQ